MSSKNELRRQFGFCVTLAHHIHIVIRAHVFKIRVFPETGFNGFNELPDFGG